VQLVSKISNLCGPDPPTSQTDGQTDRRTDDMQSQYRVLHYNASRGKKSKRIPCVGGVSGWRHRFCWRQVVQVPGEDRRWAQRRHEAILSAQFGHRISQVWSQWRHQQLQQQVWRAVEVGKLFTSSFHHNSAYSRWCLFSKET